MTEERTDEELAELLRSLPEPPAHWIEAAEQIPRIKRQIAEVLPHLEAMAADRAVETAELEAAIEAAGLEPEPRLVAGLRQYLDGV